MKRTKHTYKTLLIIALIFYPYLSQGQLFKRMTAHADELPPAYVLVQLPTAEKRVLNYFHSKHDTVSATHLITDEAMVRQKMVGDFNRYFTYCPYYYFIDTNAEKIMNGEFAGNLLDSNLHIIGSNGLPNVNDTTRFILYFGRAERNDDQWKTRRSDYLNSDYFVNGAPMLIAMDYKFHQLRSSLPYKARFGLVSIPRTEIRRYRYSSKRFDNILYKPQAAYYSATLATFYRNFRQH